MSELANDSTRAMRALMAASFERAWSGQRRYSDLQKAAFQKAKDELRGGSPAQALRWFNQAIGRPTTAPKAAVRSKADLLRELDQLTTKHPVPTVPPLDSQEAKLRRRRIAELF